MTPKGLGWDMHKQDVLMPDMLTSYFVLQGWETVNIVEMEGLCSFFFLLILQPIHTKCRFYLYLLLFRCVDDYTLFDRN